MFGATVICQFAVFTRDISIRPCLSLRSPSCSVSATWTSGCHWKPASKISGPFCGIAASSSLTRPITWRLQDCSLSRSGGGREACSRSRPDWSVRSEEHTSELQSHLNLVCRLLLEKKKKDKQVNGHDSTLSCSAQRQYS